MDQNKVKIETHYIQLYWQCWLSLYLNSKEFSAELKTRKWATVDHIFSQKNPHISLSSSTRSNIHLPFMPRSLKWPPAFTFSTRNVCYASLIWLVRATCPAHLILLLMALITSRINILLIRPRLYVRNATASTVPGRGAGKKNRFLIFHSYIQGRRIAVAGGC
jgi:hypothetical protein